jgi:choline-sulfatase
MRKNRLLVSLVRAAVAAVLAAVLLAGCSDRTSERRGLALFTQAPEKDKSSLLFITLDTFRADAAGCGGDPIGRTPHLDRLARTGVQFETGLAGVPLTLPSHVSMLTGLDGSVHGVRDNGTYRLDEIFPTLAMRLAESGFVTGAFLGAFPLDERFGLARGFEVYDDDVGNVQGVGKASLSMAQRPGSEVVASAEKWLSGLPQDSRWFCWVHLYDAHQPHEAPLPLQAAAGGDIYKADVALADIELGRALRVAELLQDDYWVLVLGDHGESHGDHEETTHGVFVYDAVIRVPAVVWPAPKKKDAGLVRRVFRTIDFPATALELLDVDEDLAPGSGVSVLSQEPGPAYMETYYPFLHYGWSELRAIQDGRWKYIEAPQSELYDLQTDPGERTNVIDRFPDVAERLSRLVAEASVQPGAEAQIALDDEARAALESLGYVTSTPQAEATDHPDPKQMIGVQTMIKTAQAMITAGAFAEAMHPLKSALAKDPLNKEVHMMIGLVHAAAGRDPQAVDSFRRSLDLPPHENDRVPRFELAKAYLRLDRPKDAENELRILLQTDPEDPGTWHNLGVALHMQDRRDEAIRAWQRVLEIAPDYEITRAVLEQESMRRRR